MIDEKKAAEEFNKLTVEMLLVQFMAVLTQKVYGCLEKPETFNQAKLGIDAMGAISQSAMPHLDSQNQDIMRQVLTEVRMAYVQKTSGK